MIFALTAFTLIGPLSIDLGTPVLPEMARVLGAEIADVQQTVALLLAGYAVAQLVAGALSDVCGRRPVLLGGLCIYTLASVVLAGAADLRLIMALRLAQGCAMAFPVVTAQALVQEFAERSTRQRVTSQLVSTRAASSVIGPVIGAFMADHFGWQAPFATMALLGMCGCGLFVVVRKRPSPPPHSRGASGVADADVDGRRPSAADADGASAGRGLLQRAMRSLFCDRTFVLLLGVEASAYSAHNLLGTTSSHVLQTYYGLPAAAFAATYGAMSVVYLVGTAVAAPLATRTRLDDLGVLRLGWRLALGAALAALVASITPLVVHSVWLTVVLPGGLISLGRGFVAVQSIAIVTEREPALVGSAVGLLFSLRVLVLACCTSALGQVYTQLARSAVGGSSALDAPPWPLNASILLLELMSASFGALLHRRLMRERKPGSPDRAELLPLGRQNTSELQALLDDESSRGSPRDSPLRSPRSLLADEESPRASPRASPLPERAAAAEERRRGSNDAAAGTPIPVARSSSALTAPPARGDRRESRPGGGVPPSD